MKNILIKIIPICLLIFASCASDDTEGISKVTVYPIVTVTGPSEELIPYGDVYTDPGAIATEDGAEIEVESSTGSGTYFGESFTTTNPDNYSTTYTAYNSDGFGANESRSLWVANTGDLTTSIEGLYISDIYRVGRGNLDGNQYVVISKTGVNTYALSHGIGGYYDLGEGYGPGYAALGTIITANDIATNDFTATDSTFPLWGDTSSLTKLTVDAASKTITYTGTTSWGAIFEVTLTQVQL